MGYRFAVTGASGFVGRYVVRLAASLRAEVVGIVRSEAAAQVVVADGGRGVVAPVLSADLLAPALRDCRAVVHLAQIGSERDGLSYEAVNVDGTAAVAEAAQRAGVARVVLFSGLGVGHFGQKPRCTSRYFLSKLMAETVLYRSGLEAVVFRPSYIVGPGDGFVPALLRDLAAGPVERPGDGRYRMQPVAARDAAACVLASVEREKLEPSRAGEPRTAVYDLVGPEALSYQHFLERLVAVARAHGRDTELRVREVPVESADAAARAGGFRGMGADELDCLLCDEVGETGPLEGLLGRFLTPLDEALGAVVRAL
ncbi:MAG TPA: NAD-dependent epimerase/dehydratase family protein [Vicinamibacteria bacterium]